MSMMLMAQSFGVQVGSASRKLVLVKLADNANDKGECWPSYQHIADQCEMSRRAVMTHINALCEAGYVTKRSRKGPKGNSSNVYLITLDGEKPAPPTDGGGEHNSPDGEQISLGGENPAPPPGEHTSPGISHSFESVSEPVSEPIGSGATPPEPSGDLVSFDEKEKATNEEPRVAIPTEMPGPKDRNAKTFKPWANYAITYRRRYGIYPIWNARAAGQMAQLVDRVGAELAPGVSAYYLGMNNQFYVSKGHPVGLMVQDCETIATQMQTGSQMTATRARQMDGTQANASAADEAKRLLGNWGE